MMDFFYSGGKFFLAPPIYDMHFRTQTQRCSCRIHGDIAAAYDSHLFTLHDRRCGIAVKCLHQIASGQIFICGEYAVGIFPRNPHELRKSCAGTYEYRIKSFFLQKLVDRRGFSDHNVSLYLYAKRFYIIDLLLNNIFLRKTELRNTIYQHAARLVQRLKNRNVIA